MSKLLVRCLAADTSDPAKLTEPLMLQVGCAIGPFLSSIADPKQGYGLIKSLLTGVIGAGTVTDGQSSTIYREEFDYETGRIIWVCCDMTPMKVTKNAATVTVVVEVWTEIEPVSAKALQARVEAGEVVYS
ncbi:hypothetical protein [Engelhardtia mirabilis]|uniref:Uncharacterized protein n=1 Tax=Engelhardtia mirabilis TaxID=2528011 RepID=A0A518BDA7_9BACT|nr:hypothetical protein Pla133_00160 [Planctomycetes bacterium Pla133]QDU99281.1 hypothetical protein Pla86_00160 [Planctomycetes bacterium Pla86]